MKIAKTSLTICYNLNILLVLSFNAAHIHHFACPLIEELRLLLLGRLLLEERQEIVERETINNRPLWFQVSKNERQFAFDYISDVEKVINADGSVSYNVKIRRLPCLPVSEATANSMILLLGNFLKSLLSSHADKLALQSLKKIKCLLLSYSGNVWVKIVNTQCLISINQFIERRLKNFSRLRGFRSCHFELQPRIPI